MGAAIFFLFITGPHGAGKTHAAHELEVMGFTCIDLGPTIRRLHKEAGVSCPLHEWISEQESIYGKNFSDKLLLGEIRKLHDKSSQSSAINGILVLGSRSLDNIKYLTEAFSEASHSHKILYVDATKEVLKTRYETRENKKISENEFKNILLKDEQMGLLHIKNAADAVITNNGTALEFSSSLIHSLQNLGYNLHEIKKTAQQPNKKLQLKP
jgi:dephospho-CoA kinase